MRAFIITIDDPVQTNQFIKNVIRERKEWVVGVAISKGSRLTLGKKKSKKQYLFSLLLIMGLKQFVKNSWLVLFNKIMNKLSGRFGWAKKNTFKGWLEQEGIPVKIISSPNAPSFISFLNDQNIDVIINQSSAILKVDLLGVPSIGTINRHNALLPRNRGRLTPFWVLYRGEKETGVSIHFVNEKLDDGPIIVQKRFTVSPKDNFNSLVSKNYQIAPVAMIEALDILASGDGVYQNNDHKKATYNTTPTLKEAFKYRKRRLKRLFQRGKQPLAS